MPSRWERRIPKKGDDHSAAMAHLTKVGIKEFARLNASLENAVLTHMLVQAEKPSSIMGREMSGAASRIGLMGDNGRVLLPLAPQRKSKRLV